MTNSKYRQQAFSDEIIKNIAAEFRNYFKRRAQGDKAHIWDTLFDELIKQNKKYPGTLNIIYLSFKDRHSHTVICDELFISTTTYYNLRRVILEQAALRAYCQGLLTIT